MLQIKYDRALVFNATFSNISVISLRSVLMLKETGDYQQPVTNH